LLLFPCLAEAASKAADPDILSKILMKFQTNGRQWGAALQGAALSLFGLLLIIDVVWMGVRMALKRAGIEETFVEFIRLLVFATFMYVVILYHKEWANAMIGGLGRFAEVDLKAVPMKAGDIFYAGLNMVGTIWDEISAWEPANAVGLIFFGIALTIVFAIITAQVVLVKCEAFIVLNLGTLMLGFGGSGFTKEYAINFLRYTLAIAMKLFVMQMLITLAMTFMQDMTGVKADYEELAVVLGAAIILLALTMSIPDVVAGIVNGSHVSTGTAITSAVSAVSMATMAAMKALPQGIGAAAGAKTAIGAVKEASQLASASGASGVGKGLHMANSLKDAAHTAKSPTFAENVASNLRATREAFQMEQEADQGSKK